MWYTKPLARTQLQPQKRRASVTRNDVDFTFVHHAEYGAGEVNVIDKKTSAMVGNMAFNINGTTATVFDAGIEEEYRGAGIGKSMYVFALQNLRRLGMQQLKSDQLLMQDARRVYESLGRGGWGISKGEDAHYVVDTSGPNLPEERRASRTLKSPERTWHATGQDYTHPIIDTDPNSPINKLGFGENVFGTGHYTSQNQGVIEGYQKSLNNNGEDTIIRKYNLPRGTRILDRDAIPVDEARQLLMFLLQKQGRDIKSHDPYPREDTVTLQTVLNDAFLDDDQGNHLLQEFGYDAIEYLPYTNFDKADMREQDRGKKNVLILNDQIINNPREFTRSRLRSDTEQGQPKNSKSELYMRGAESGKIPLGLLPASVLSDPATRKRAWELVNEKFRNSDVRYTDLPPWAQLNPDLVRFGLNYLMIEPYEIPLALGQDEAFMRSLFEDGLIPLWALPESLRQSPEYASQAAKKDPWEDFEWDAKEEAKSLF